MYRHSRTTFIIVRLKKWLYKPTLITHNPLSLLHKQSQLLERALNSSTKSLSNQGISPREKRGWSSGCDTHLGAAPFPCGLSPWWSHASAWRLKGCKHSSKQEPMKKMTPWVQRRQRGQQQQSTWSVWRLPGGFLMEKALRQKVIIFAPGSSVIIHCEDKHIIKSRQRGRGRCSYYHPQEIYALQGWVLLSEWARSVWWGGMSLAFSRYYMSWTAASQQKLFP